MYPWATTYSCFMSDGLLCTFCSIFIYKCGLIKQPGGPRLENLCQTFPFFFFFPWFRMRRDPICPDFPVEILVYAPKIRIGTPNVPGFATSQKCDISDSAYKYLTFQHFERRTAIICPRTGRNGRKR